MKKTMSLMAIAVMSTAILAGCQDMSPSNQRIGAAALGGAVGGGVVFESAFAMIRTKEYYLGQIATKLAGRAIGCA